MKIVYLNSTAMMNKNICEFIFVALFVSLVSCSQEAKETASVDFARKQGVKMSDLISDYSIVPLETHEDNLISDASIVRIYENNIYVMDCFSQNKGIYVFDLQGKYKGKIGSVGGGPGEYIMPMSLAIDDINGRVVVRDVALNKLLCYDSKTFKFIKEQSLAFYADCLEFLKDETVVWYVGSGCANLENYQNHIQVTDLQGNVLESYIPRKEFPKRSMYNVMTYFHKYAGKLFFHHPFSNVIYSINNGAEPVVAEYLLSCDNLTFPTEDYVIENRNEIIKQLERDGYVQFFDLQENSEKILCYFGTSATNYIGVYSKENREGVYTAIDDIEDDMGIMKFVRPKTVYGDHFVSVVYTEALDSLPNSSVLKPYLNGEGDNGNPFVLFYK